MAALSTELVEFLRAQCDADERVAPEVHAASCPAVVSSGMLYAVDLDSCTCGWPKRLLAEVGARRAILAEHEPEWQTVEWPHDQNGKGEALVCRRCQNAEYTRWNPPQGQAGVLPEGFVTPYVLAPCSTLLAVAQPYAGREGWREEWRA